MTARAACECACQFAHLYRDDGRTSVCIYMHTYAYVHLGSGAGSKWPVSKLREYMQNNGIDDRGIWGRINNIIVLTVLALWPKIPAQTSGFELLGFDIMIDEELNPWLIEVNSSPALATESPLDCEIKVISSSPPSTPFDRPLVPDGKQGRCADKGGGEGCRRR